MARPPRPHIPGAVYHVLSRGNARQTIFFNDNDYRRFQNTLSAEKARSPFDLYAYCLMPNHLHLLIHIQERPLSTIMQRILTRYSAYLNFRRNMQGHVFQGRYKSFFCKSDAYLLSLARYIHLNPVRAGLVDHPKSWAWSSHAHYIGMKNDDFVDSGFLLSIFDRYIGTARDRFEEFMSQSIRTPLPAPIPHEPAVLPASLRQIYPTKDAPPSHPLDLESIATSISIKNGLRLDFIQGPSHTRAVSAIRKEFIRSALQKGFGPSMIARFLHRSTSGICKLAARPVVKKSKESTPDTRNNLGP